MQPPYPSPVPTWHNDTYDSINPSKPHLNQEGKTVIITGAGSGIGRATAIAFGTAGAARLVLIGRTESTLRETCHLLPGNPRVNIYAISVTNEAAIRKVAEEVGAWDILILGAAYPISVSPLVEANFSDWWAQYEVSVKATVVAAQAFLPNAKEGASLYGITSNVVAMSASFIPGYSAYQSAKLAQVKILEFIAAEGKHVNVVSVHPGTIDTGMFRSAGADPNTLPMDTVELPAHFMVWLSQPRANFLNGKTVWANWDVDELAVKAENIGSSSIMTIGCEGWPFSHDT